MARRGGQRSALMGRDAMQLNMMAEVEDPTLPQAYAKPGDAVVVTDQDHEANTGAWRRLAEHGAEIREWRIDPETGHLDPQDLAALLGDAALPELLAGWGSTPLLAPSRGRHDPASLQDFFSTPGLSSLLAKSDCMPRQMPRNGRSACTYCRSASS